MAVIFDFEGTLVDFRWRLAPAEAELRAALASIGFRGEVFERGNYATMWNTAARALAPRARIGELRDALGPIYDRWDADALTRWAPRGGAAALLERLAAAGVRAGMVSNVGRRALSSALSRFGYERWLQPVVSRDDVSLLKPDREGIGRVLDAWQVDARDVLLVGDSRADVLGARAAGIRVAIIRGGECSEADFAECPPDHLISGLDEVETLLIRG